MATTTAPPDQAAADLQTARDHLDELHRRIGDGDSKVTAKQLGEAEQAIQLAELRVEAAERHAAEQAEAERQDAIARLISDVETLLDGDSLDRLKLQVEQFATAADGLLAEWKSQRDTSTEITRRAAALEPLPPEFGKSVVPGRPIIYRGKRTAPAKPDALIAGVLHFLLRQYGVDVDRAMQSSLYQLSNVSHKKAGPLGEVMERHATPAARQILDRRPADD